MIHKDPQQNCIKCGYSYGFADEECTHCGFQPLGAGQAEQEKAEADFSIWQNSGRDHDPLA